MDYYKTIVRLRYYEISGSKNSTLYNLIFCVYMTKYRFIKK